MTIPKHIKLSTCILQLLKQHNIIENDNIYKLIIFGTEYSDFIIKFNDKEVRLEKQYELGLDLVNTLKLFDIIGCEAHIQSLFMKFVGQEPPIIKIKILIV